MITLLFRTAASVIKSRQALVLENLDHVIVRSEKHLLRVLREYVRYYHESRTHLGLGKDCPKARPVEPPHLGVIRAEPMVGGLHHRYFRQAA
ncbi:MAG: hypothetical protein KAY32_03320 [Candidatus Eisenbacteria sp.]|nr:hypothetical protein [Candidatus Eisenbacteria bacterium]